MKSRVGRISGAASFLIGVCFALSASAAGNASNQTIDKLMMGDNYGQILFINMSGSISTLATCATHPNWDFVLNTSTELGTQMYAVLVKSYANNLAIRMTGKDTCSVFESIETLRRFELT